MAILRVNALRMQQDNSLGLEEMGAQLRGSETIRFEAQNRGEVYGWVQPAPAGQEYHTLGKKEIGTVRAYATP